MPIKRDLQKVVWKDLSCSVTGCLISHATETLNPCMGL